MANQGRLNAAKINTVGGGYGPPAGGSYIGPRESEAIAVMGLPQQQPTGADMPAMHVAGAFAAVQQRFERLTGMHRELADRLTPVLGQPTDSGVLQELFYGDSPMARQLAQIAMSLEFETEFVADLIRRLEV